MKKELGVVEEGVLLSIKKENAFLEQKEAFFQKELVSDFLLSPKCGILDRTILFGIYQLGFLSTPLVSLYVSHHPNVPSSYLRRDYSSLLERLVKRGFLVSYLFGTPERNVTLYSLSEATYMEISKRAHIFCPSFEALSFSPSFIKKRMMEMQFVLHRANLVQSNFLIPTNEREPFFFVNEKQRQYVYYMDAFTSCDEAFLKMLQNVLQSDMDATIVLLFDFVLDGEAFAKHLYQKTGIKQFSRVYITYALSKREGYYLYRIKEGENGAVLFRIKEEFHENHSL